MRISYWSSDVCSSDLDIVDVDLDEVRPAVLARELLQVDGGGDADRKADQEADEERVERADEGASETCHLRKATVGGGEQGPVKRHRNQPGCDKPAIVPELLVADAALIIPPGARGDYLVKRIERIGQGRRGATRHRQEEGD